MNDIVRLADFSLDELNDWLAANVPSASQAYRGAQIYRWLGLGAPDFGEMTNLPSALRSELASLAATGIPQIAGTTRSAADGTVKFAMRTCDGLIIESVLMRYRHGDAVCVSSQAGCKMGCAFCATKPGSFSRSLSPGEIFGQVVAVNRQENVKANHVVVMGIGEPFNNYDATMKSIRLLHDHQETNIGYRMVTISTCGIVPGIERLAAEGLPVGLSASLHAASDEIRSALMPVNRSFSIDKLIEGCKIYTCKTKRRVTFEYALIDGKNDAPDDAKALLRLIRGMLCHINLIPVNYTGNPAYTPPPAERVRRFYRILTDGGAQVTVRRELGADVSAACGQLRNSKEGRSSQ